ncbi:glycoside hydrolase family 5 protein [Crucibulum laeve]|uniref:mannan endo-1,4-beta-mannosidase n=1 Tax=Crucibulum laeve TaxID=68775 RepID=A0A5C3MCE9_9AGAR|nr:glycoside hydrolase family 5 protein [Crucibulum laeve]
MYISVLWQLVLGTLLVTTTRASRDSKVRRNNETPPSNFVTTSPDGQFMVNGSAFSFVGTNAYWLHALNSDDDIDRTLQNISMRGIKVVRTWAFNDVSAIPENGTWFQLIVNGTTTINNGTNGLQRLDKVVELAQKHGIYLLLSLTNNWNPTIFDNANTSFTPLGVLRDATNSTNVTLPRNTLSNDYGGMDAYVRQFVSEEILHHDQFFMNQTIINAFTNYTTNVVSRYTNSSAVFGWELANDPRCNSTVQSSGSCTPQVITRWHSTVAQSVKEADPNHLVSSGNQGFFCMDCPKLFPTAVAPPPRPSPAPDSKRRSLPKALTKSILLQERKEARKRTRKLQKRSNPRASGIRIRGNWVATPTRRQDDTFGVGPAFDGSQGVDSEDIINIPQIGFGSFQLFPDQNSYGVDDPNLPAFNNTVQQGLDWIQRHADMGKLFGKPVSLTGFGLVTQGNAPFFVPFNSTVAPFGPDQVPESGTSQQQPFGVTDAQRDDAYSQWLNAGLINGLQGMIQYQWAQDNLTSQEGTAISPSITESGLSPDQTTTGLSPNDGYSIQGVGQEQAAQVIQEAANNFAPDTA